MAERTIKLTLAYDGTDFCGWQTQKQGERTVQAVLEQALHAIHGHEVKTHAAGRTDSGVHATAQVAHFHSDHTGIGAVRFTDALNSHLPHDLRVLESSEADTGFHARYSARARLYRYYVYMSPVGLPHFRRFCFRIRRRLDVNLLNSAARAVVGVHDFTSFTASGDTSESREREVFTSCFYPRGPFLVYEIRANAFLWKMVRSIVGTVISLALRGDDPRGMREILEARDRSRAGPTAPARGLFLEGVSYEQQ
jgi:tRNA pseudouridine38-40 synthase